MASDAASPDTTAKVLRATAGQVRLQLDGGREVTKRVTVPAEARETLEGADVPVRVSGSGTRVRVELVDGWLDAATSAAGKPARKRRARTGGDETPPSEPKGGAARKPRAKKAPPAEAAPETPAAEQEAPSEKPSRRRSGGRGKTAPAADAPAEDAAPKASRSRRGGKKAEPEATPESPAKADIPVATPAVAPAPEVVERRIAAAVELVRAARAA